MQETIIGPIAGLIDRIVPDPAARDAAKLELLRLGEAHALEDLRSRLLAAAGDPWTSRARPAFLYVMYLLLLWAIPMGLVGAVRPDVAAAIAASMRAYLAAIPEPLYALFGTGYLGYTAARQWGKVKGVEK